jgi:hypothetical protein
MRATWQDVNPAPGTWNWSTLAYRISQIRSSGSRVLYVMGMTPAWAAADPSAGDPRWGLGTSSAPANMDTWREYVDRLVSEFGGSIDAYELWNEANLKTFWTGSVTDLAHMTRIAYDVIQAKDPSALLLAPSITTRLTVWGELHAGLRSARCWPKAYRSRAGPSTSCSRWRCRPRRAGSRCAVLPGGDGRPAGNAAGGPRTLPVVRYRGGTAGVEGPANIPGAPSAR